MVGESYLHLINKLPNEVKLLFAIFGDDIRLVGGCVRDLIIAKEVNDFDFATKFLPEKVTEILEKNNIKAVPTGIKFGTITAVVNGKNFEITTLRKDLENDGRYCKAEFVDDYFVDASRRDFTINALYLDEKGQVFDYFSGISDLKQQKVRFIGDANQRIEEDFLRILRFFRFSCSYAQEIDNQGLAACIKHKENISQLSRERIRSEFVKIITASDRKNIIKILRLIDDSQIAAQIFSCKIVIENLQNLFKLEENLKITSDLDLKFAALFLSENLDVNILTKEICLTNIEKRFLKNSQVFDINNDGIGYLLAEGKKYFLLKEYLLFLVQNFAKINYEEAQKNIDFLQNFNLPNFPLNGEDLIKNGFKEGREVGVAIKSAKKYWAESGFKLNKSDLINMLGE